MSLFSNDMRVANTAAPSFTSEANVGQFGWTGSDQGHYNQLIQYVDECRKIWVNLEEKILFVENLLQEVTEIDSQVKYIEQMTNQVIKLSGETKIFRDQTAQMYNEIKPLIDSFFPAYEDALKKYQDVILMHSETEQAAIAAAQSELNAAASAKAAADTAEELRKGQVYRGTWNIQANNGYPAAPDTNSVWDIVLNEGVTEFKFDNTTWFWGDRLLYLKDDAAFTQIESGSTVISVNGKGGAVTLTAADVGAPTVRHDKRIIIENPQDGGPIGVIKSQEGTTWLVQGDDAVPQHVAIGVSTASGPVYYDGTESPQIFHEKFLPTSNQVGAVSKAGDTMTGALFMGDNHKSVESVGNDLHLTANQGKVVLAGTQNPIVYVGGASRTLYHEGFKPTSADIGAVAVGNSREDALGDSGIYTGQPADFNTLEAGFSGLIPLAGSTNSPPWEASGDGHVHVEVQRLLTNEVLQSTLPFRGSTTTAHRTFKYDGTWTPWYTAYTNGYKPTAVDVGALPLSGGELSGGLLVNANDPAPLTIRRASQVGVKFESGVNHRYLGVGNDGNLHYGANADHGSNFLVYSSGNKPTAVDVGALPASGGTISGSLDVSGGLTLRGTGNVQALHGGYLRCNTDSVMSVDGKEYVFVTSKRDAHLCNNAYWNGRDWLKYEDGVESHYIAAKEGGLEHFWSEAGSSNPNQHRGVISSSHNTGYVSATSVLVPEGGNGWIIGDYELLVYRFPGGVHVKGIIRRNPAVGKVNNVIFYLHANAKVPYSTFLLDKATSTAPNGWSYTENLNFNSNAVSSGGWDAQTGWIMVDFMIQFQ